MGTFSTYLSLLCGLYQLCKMEGLIFKLPFCFPGGVLRKYLVYILDKYCKVK